MTKEEKAKLKALRKEEKTLLKQLEKAQLQVVALETLITVAERQFNVPIRKEAESKK